MRKFRRGNLSVSNLIKIFEEDNESKTPIFEEEINNNNGNVKMLINLHEKMNENELERLYTKDITPKQIK